jgi:nucleoside-diphosphate-sugar epimerase
MTSDRTILIAGVTGHQGGAVALALQGTGFHLRGLTRTPGSERAVVLAASSGPSIAAVWVSTNLLASTCRNCWSIARC